MYNWGHYYGRANPSEWKKAEKSILEGNRILDKLEVFFLIAHNNLLAGEMLLEAGQHDRAKEYLTQAESSFREMTCDYWADKAKRALDRI